MVEKITKENLYDLANAFYTFPRNFYHILKTILEDFTVLKYRENFFDSVVKASRAAYSGDMQNMEHYFKIMRIDNEKIKEVKPANLDNFEERLRADFGKKEKLTLFEKELKSAGLTL